MAPSEIAAEEEVEVEVEDIPRAYWLPDGVYDALKWCALVLLPAVGTFYSGMAAVWGWPFAEEIPISASWLALLIGMLIGISEISASIGKGK